MAVEIKYLSCSAKQLLELQIETLSSSHSFICQSIFVKMYITFTILGVLLSVPLCVSFSCFHCFGMETKANYTEALACLNNDRHKIIDCMTTRCFFLHGSEWHNYCSYYEPYISNIILLSVTQGREFSSRGCATLEHCLIAESIPHTNVKVCTICENDLCNGCSRPMIGHGIIFCLLYWIWLWCAE